jgi:hypothetical protein
VWGVLSAHVLLLVRFAYGQPHIVHGHPADVLLLLWASCRPTHAAVALCAMAGGRACTYVLGGPLLSSRLPSTDILCGPVLLLLLCASILLIPLSGDYHHAAV